MSSTKPSEWLLKLQLCFLSVVCLAPPLGPAFGTVNTSVSEEGVVISWDYFGRHKNVYVEYIVENSKASCSRRSQSSHNVWLVWLLCWLSFLSVHCADFPGKDDWKKELVNGSHWYMIKGLKPGTSYRVRVVARDPTDPTVHSTDEVLVAVPGEAACLRVDFLVFSFFHFFCSYPLIIFLLLHCASHLDSKSTQYLTMLVSNERMLPEIGE